MGKTVDIVDIENARKRSDKALRGHGYTGNLAAFRHSATPGKQTSGRSAMARFKAMQPKGEDVPSEPASTHTDLPQTPPKSVAQVPSATAPSLGDLRPAPLNSVVAAPSASDSASSGLPQTQVNSVKDAQPTVPTLEQSLADLEQTFIENEGVKATLPPANPKDHNGPTNAPWSLTPPESDAEEPLNLSKLEQSAADLKQTFAENEGVQATSRPLQPAVALQGSTLEPALGLGHDPVSQKKMLLGVVLGSLMVGAILGSVWTLTKTRSDIRENSNSLVDAEQPGLSPEVIAPVVAGQPNNAPEVDTAVVAAEQPNLTQEVIAPEVVAEQPDITPVVVEQPNLAPQVTAPAVAVVEPTPAEPAEEPVPPSGPSLESQVASYQEEINWLNQQNVSLTKKVNSLTDETLILNKELLELEIETVKSQPKPRVVYNFVNVPIGDASGTGAVSTYTEPVVYQDNNSYTGDNQISGDAGYSESQEYRELYEYAPEDGEPIYDPETGLYLSPEMLNERAEQQYVQPGSQVVYPPVSPEVYSQ